MQLILPLEPSACDLVTDFGINILWQPSLGLELGDNVTYADSYSFDGRSGSYWYETDDDPYFDRIYGKLRRVSVFITTPRDPIPVPAVPVAPSLPLLAAGLLAMGALRRR